MSPIFNHICVATNLNTCSILFLLSLLKLWCFELWSFLHFWCTFVLQGPSPPSFAIWSWYFQLSFGHKFQPMIMMLVERSWVPLCGWCCRCFGTKLILDVSLATASPVHLECYINALQCYTCKFWIVTICHNDRWNIYIYICIFILSLSFEIFRHAPTVIFFSRRFQCGNHMKPFIARTRRGNWRWDLVFFAAGGRFFSGKQPWLTLSVCRWHIPNRSTLGTVWWMNLPEVYEFKLLQHQHLNKIHRHLLPIRSDEARVISFGTH